MAQPALQVAFGQSGMLLGRYDPLANLPLRRTELGSGTLDLTSTGARLSISDCPARRYSNAQLDDCGGRAPRDFPWRPPLRLSVRARFSHEPAGFMTRPGLRGTAGFGFWNDPLLMAERPLPALPRAIWFFYASPPSDMKFDVRTPGYGWKAATIDASRLPAPLLALSAPIVVPLMNVRAIYRAFWPFAQRALHISEAPVPASMTAWHTYVIEWGTRRARFRVDDLIVMDCNTSPRGPLGLVIWLDNQFLIATPWGHLRHGLLSTSGAHWLELDWLEISPLVTRVRESRSPKTHQSSAVAPTMAPR
jgi:hypothetical protein